MPLGPKGSRQLDGGVGLREGVGSARQARAEPLARWLLLGQLVRIWAGICGVPSSSPSRLSVYCTPKELFAACLSKIHTNQCSDGRTHRGARGHRLSRCLALLGLLQTPGTSLYPSTVPVLLLPPLCVSEAPQHFRAVLTLPWMPRAYSPQTGTDHIFSKW